ncbi:MAG: hypothetical protein IT229_12430, partial [Flavobacteriales bacterium]|nr:hypothetical protein [Flavobacteriales bacterium]
MITASNGDLLLALVAEPQISNDTVHMYGELKRISSAGTPLWSRSYDHSQPMSSGSSGGFLVKLSEDLDGNIFMLHGGATFGVNDRYLITMLDQGGTLLWSKRFGLGTADPVLPHGPGSRLDLTPDNLGGCYLTFGSSENIDIWMARLDGNGDLDWSKSVTFSGSSTNTIQSGAIADATGHYTVALSSYLAIGPQQLRIRFDQAGQLQYVDGYDLNTATVYQELDHSSGSQVVTGSHTFVLDSVGTPISVSVPVIRSSGDTTFTHVGVAMDVHDGMIHLYGAYRWFHNIWGTIGYNPDVIRIPLQGPLGCAADTFNVLRTPFPNNLFQNAPFVWGAPFDASPLVASGPASFIPQGLLTTAEICGTGTGISDHHDQGPVFRIIGNPMTSGAPLEISCDRPVRISIYNATGSLVHETRLGPGVSAVPL